MTHVSKRKVKPAVVDKITRQFAAVIARADNKARADDLVGSLFTKAERAMLAKRLAAIVMLEYGYSFDDVENTLKVSSRTVARIWRDKKNGKYTPIERICRKKLTVGQSQDSFLEFVEILLQAGLPPRGRGRWKWLYETK